MSFKTIQQRINDAVLQMRASNRVGSHLNCIRLNSGCSDKHNNKIIDICKELLETKTGFYTEAIFNSGHRADIFIPALNEIIEVLHTESDQRFSEKIKNYPENFTIRKVRA